MSRFIIITACTVTLMWSAGAWSAEPDPGQPLATDTRLAQVDRHGQQQERAQGLQQRRQQEREAELERRRHQGAPGLRRPETPPGPERGQERGRGIGQPTQPGRPPAAGPERGQQQRVEPGEDPFAPRGRDERAPRGQPEQNLPGPERLPGDRPPGARPDAPAGQPPAGQPPAGTGQAPDMERMPAEDHAPPADMRQGDPLEDRPPAQPAQPIEPPPEDTGGIR